MSVALESYQPVLDPALDVIRELSENKEAELVVPNHPVAVGLAVDIQNLIFRLYPYFDSEIIITGVRKSYQILGKTLVSGEIRETLKGKKEKGIDNLLLKIQVTHGDFEMSNREYLTNTILDIQNKESHNFPSRIDVSPRDAKFIFPSHLTQYLRKNEISLPSKVEKIALSLSYASVVPFYIHTFYQDFESSSTSTDKTHSQYPAYPVSSKEQHLLPYSVWKLIQLPVFRNSWGFYYGSALMVLSGEKTIEEIARRPRHIEPIRKHVDKAIPTIYEILETLIEKRQLGDVLRKWGVQNEYYIGLSLHSLLKALNHLGNVDSLAGPRRQYLENLVERYNNGHASLYEKRKITAEELVDTLMRNKYQAQEAIGV